VTTTLWHLDVLGLPAHADEVAIRRAYATALRRIDPEVEPAAFENLRRAYEAARAWCEATAVAAVEKEPSQPAEVAVASDDDTMVEDDTAQSPGENIASPDVAPTVSIDYTIHLAWRFAADVGARRADAIPSMLDGILAELRTQYIDAPGQFEEHLIDLVGHQRVAHRAEVFAAAETRFHWSEVGHLSALGQRGQWIELVLAQREAWLALAPDRRRSWTELFVQAEARLDTSLLARWPEIARLNERFPAWLGLHLSDETLQAWKAAFDAQPSSAREVYMNLAPPESAYLPAHIAATRQARRQRSATWVLASFFLAMFVGVAQFVVTGIREGFPVSLTSPVVGNGTPADTPRQCVELYAELDKPDAFDGRPLEEVALLKARAHRCERAGHWHPPTRETL
jgi:hypothetical protein